MRRPALPDRLRNPVHLRHVDLDVLSGRNVFARVVHVPAHADLFTRLAGASMAATIASGASLMVGFLLAHIPNTFLSLLPLSLVYGWIHLMQRK